MKPLLGIKAELRLEVSKVEGAYSAVDVGPIQQRSRLRFESRGRKLLSFASWDFLGLADHREVRIAACSAIEQHGVGSSSTRTLGGLASECLVCERAFAEFLGGESAVLFGSKNQAVLTCITSLFGEGDVLLIPSDCQSPVADACALAGAECVSLDGDTLALQLEKFAGRRRVVLFLETVSIASGAARDLSVELAEAERCGAWVILDESAAVGVMGLRGGGAADGLVWPSCLLAKVVNGGLALGVGGAAVVGSNELRDLLLARSRYLRCEISENPATAAGLLKAIELAEVSIGARELLSRRSKFLFEGISRQGWKVLGGTASCIVGIAFDTFRSACRLQDALFQRGLVVEPLPLKSRGRDGGIVRILVSILHADAEIAYLLESLSVVKTRSRTPQE